MKIIDLIYKIYNKELKNNTLLKLTYDNNKIEYWKYKNGKLYWNNEENDYQKEDEMDLFSYLHDRNILVEIMEEKPNKISKLEKRCECVRDGLFPHGFGREYYDKEDIIAKIEELRNAVNYLLEKSDSE